MGHSEATAHRFVGFDFLQARSATQAPCQTADSPPSNNSRDLTRSPEESGVNTPRFKSCAARTDVEKFSALPWAALQRRIFEIEARLKITLAIALQQAILNIKAIPRDSIILPPRLPGPRGGPAALAFVIFVPFVVP